MPFLLKYRYQVLETLSEAGGFGQTFLAEDTDTPSRRRCVIKKLRPIANPDDHKFVQERFRREAAILEKLGDASDQIPKLYAFFIENQDFYLVQELVEGLTLRQKVQQEGRLSENAVNELLISLLNVLAYVHGQKIIHRDIKPDNIILRKLDNKPVLIDFGIVKEVLHLDADGNPTSTMMAGTPGYTSLEQAAGRPVFASDLYSLGVTAIFLLTGKNPRQMTDLVTGEINWQQHAPEVSSDFVAILDKATESLPQNRYQTAHEMRQAFRVLSGVRPVYKSGSEGIAEAETIVEPSSDKILLIPYCEGSKWGFCDVNKKLVIEAQYDHAVPFKEGLALVELGNKYGFIDKKGNIVIPIIFDGAEHFREGLAQVRQGDLETGKNGFINKAGNLVIPFKYDLAGDFSEGLACVNQGDKWGFIDKTDNLIIPLKYDWAESFSEGFAAVKQSRRWGFVDKTGSLVIPIKYGFVSSFSDGLVKVYNFGDKEGFIDKKGNVVIPIVYDAADLFKEGLAWVRRGYKYGFMDKKGNLVIPLNYDSALYFSEGLAPVKQNGKWGFIDKTGKVIIPIKYDAVHSFREGLAWVKQGEQQFYIGKNGIEYYVP